MIHVIDLHFLKNNETIAAFLVETSVGPVLIETGPYSTFSHLQKGVEEAGFKLDDIRHVLLSHIHFDHAGAAWALAEKGAQIYVHPFGAKHIAEPGKLTESARKIYQDQMDVLWGDIRPIDKALIHETADQEELTVGDCTFKAWHTPGHASHHIAWQLGDAVFTGDVAGVRIGRGPVVAPCPPPDINIEQWETSINTLRALKPAKMYLTHYGCVTDYAPHLDQLEKGLHEYAAYVKELMHEGIELPKMIQKFEAFAAKPLVELGFSKEEVAQYNAANPAFMSVTGLMRYWKKKAVTQ
ncbi:MBL fold metallo-hydrolase [Microscilla marina]|nr:MBL fold metallo-hydrolase [Microscilla marina]